jgi:hypothetical protein
VEVAPALVAKEVNQVEDHLPFIFGILRRESSPAA